MAVMPERVQELFTEVDDVFFSTATAEGQPNMCIVGMKKLIDAETVYLSDQFFKKTLANVQANPKVAVLIWKGREAYVLHGTARYVNEGAEFEELKSWVDEKFASMGMPIKAKGGVFVTVESVYTSTPGGTAGDQIA
ncbi:MAG: pyridoxamine 5'-phosphate oxidase family protein [Coriobacteriales bacterium]|jgi:predicted pyridoxine 5'-phosphate oxidase superfamily flavin-nucleotide-binding protein